GQAKPPSGAFISRMARRRARSRSTLPAMSRYGVGTRTTWCGRGFRADLRSRIARSRSMKQALTMQHGFTLIEALIAVALLGLVVIGTLGATITFSRRAAAFAEAGELEERRSVLIDTLQADVDQAGRNLSITSTYGSGTEACIFSPDSYYISTLSGASTS